MAGEAMNPATGRGFLNWALLGLGGAAVALVIAAFFPSIIPARATTVRL